jgi:hypothetical protein
MEFRGVGTTTAGGGTGMGPVGSGGGVRGGLGGVEDGTAADAGIGSDAVVGPEPEGGGVTT